MKKLLILILSLASFAALGQNTNVFTGLEIKNSHAADSSRVGKIWYHAATAKFRFWDGGGKHTFGVGTGGGTVTSVSGTTNRITSSGGATPVIDISATFEALLGKVANPLSQFASTTSAQLAGVLSNETGTGLAVFATSPTLVTPVLGTPTSATLTNATGLPISTGVSGLGTGIATFLGTPSSANLATALTDETGTGVAVFSASPTFTGVPLAPTATLGTNTTQLATTAGVLAEIANVQLGPFSTTDPGYVNLSGAAGSLLKGDNTFLTIGANGTVLTSNGITFSWAAGGGGITNAAANTEIPLSNGTNLIASTLFYASRTLTMGTAAAGATITLQAAGSATDVGFNFFNKGAGQFQFNGTGSTLANHFFNQVNSLTVNHYSTDATGVFLVLSKLRGTGGSPTTDANGDVLGNLDFQGYDGTSTINSARIKGVLNGTISTGVTPTDIVFQTTATNTVVDAMKISSLGVVSLTGNATQAGELRLYEITGSGTNFTSFKSPALAADVVYTLPPDDGNNTDHLQTDGSGVLTWVAAGMTNPMTTTGDLISSSSGSTPARIAAVATGQLFISKGTSTLPAWSNTATLTTSTNGAYAGLTIANTNAGSGAFSTLYFGNDVSTTAAGGLFMISGANTGYGNLSSLNLINFTSTGGLSLGTNNISWYKLTSSGNHSFTQAIQSATNTFQTWTQSAHTGGSPVGLLFTGGAHTTLATTVEATDINFNLARTVQFATGAIATQRAIRIQAPTYGFIGASTITDAATVDISGGPIAGTNATITNTWGLRNGGRTQLGGSTGVSFSGNNVGIGGAELVGVGVLTIYDGTTPSLTAGQFSLNSILGDARITNANGVSISVGGAIFDYLTDVNNATTTETDLYSTATLASTLSTNGDKLYIKYSGTFNDVTATTQLKIYFGGTVIGDTGALTVSAIGGWEANAIVIRTGSTTVRASVNISTPGASTALYTKETDVTGLTLSNTNVVKITGQAGGASGGSNDITAKFGSMFFVPAAP